MYMKALFGQYRLQDKGKLVLADQLQQLLVNAFMHQVCDF
jgi:hypothetical protein